MSLASVIFHFYGAIAHCLANPEAMDQYLKSQEQVWDEFRGGADPLPEVIARRLQGAHG